MKKTLTSLALFVICTISSYAYNVSENGKKQIMLRESCSLTVYKDNKGYSIGYGHRLKKGEKYKKISKNKAEQLFREDIKSVEVSINRILKDIKFKPTQNFIDGLADLVYNCGESGVKKSEFYKRLCYQSFIHGWRQNN